MITITKHLNEIDTHTSTCDDIVVFYKTIVDDIKLGWRLYEKSVDETNDITHNINRLHKAKDIIMLRPALGVGLITVGIIAAVAVGVSVYAISKIDEQATGANRTQSSNTNSLGARTNQAAINSRVPDIYGFVSKHVPPLLQVPHFRFTSGVEVENFALIVSEGEGEITNVQDGETSFSRLVNSKINFWKNGDSPNNNTSPYLSIGGDIDRELYSVYQSRELQSGEMLPPNEISSGDVSWRITGNGNTGTITAVTENEEFDLRSFFSIGSDVNLNSFYRLSPLSTLTVYYDSSSSQNVATLDKINLSTLPYEALEVNQLSIVLDLSGQVDFVVDGWNDSVDYDIPLESSNLTWFQGQLPRLAVTTDNLPDSDLYADSGKTQQISISVDRYTPGVGEVTAGIIGFYQVPTGTTLISFNVVASQGYYKLRDGQEERLDHDFLCIIEATDVDGLPTGSTREYNFNFGSSANNITSPNGVTVDVSGSNFEYQRVGFRRVSLRDKSDNISNVDKAILRDLYFYTELEKTPNWGDVTIAQVEIYSNSESQGVKERQINLDFERKIHRYSNGQFEACRNIADVITAIALDPKNGRLGINDIDADLYQEIEEQLIDYFGTSDMIEVGYCLDTTKMRFQEIYTMFWRACMCESYAQGASYKAYPDILRDDSSKQFTHRNKIIGTDSSESIYDKEFDGVELSYRSEITGQFETVERFLNDVDAVNPMHIELTCAINAKQAQVRADRELNIIKHQRKSFSFEAEGIALLTVPGERVDVVDDSRIVKRENNEGTYEIYSGYVVNQSALEIELSEPVYFADDDLHTIRFTDKNGDLLESIACDSGSSKYHVILASAPSQPIYVGYKQERTNFTFSADRLRSGLAVLVRGLESGNKNGTKTRKISGIDYSELYYQNDKD